MQPTQDKDPSFSEAEYLKRCDDVQEYWNRTDQWTEKVSHFHGSPRCPPNAFNRVGNLNFQRFARCCELAGQNPRDYRTMLEWGPGGGANLCAFAPHFDRMYGVDVSEHSLQKATDQLRTRSQAHRWQPIHIHCSNPQDVFKLVNAGSLDFFLSTSCYQHFPTKKYGEMVTLTAWTLLRPGGLAVIQTRWDDGSGYYRTKEDLPYCGGDKRNAIRAVSYGIGEFFGIAYQSGFIALSKLELAKANYAYYFLEKKR